MGAGGEIVFFGGTELIILIIVKLEKSSVPQEALLFLCKA
jgi:hypothetical protein